MNTPDASTTTIAAGRSEHGDGAARLKNTPPGALTMPNLAGALAERLGDATGADALREILAVAGERFPDAAAPKGQPVTFASCVGQLYPADGPVAVLMLGAIGYEEMCCPHHLAHARRTHPGGRRAVHALRLSRRRRFDRSFELGRKDWKTGSRR